MKMRDLMALVQSNTDVVLCDDNGNEITTSKERLNEVYGSVEPTALWVCGNKLCIEAEAPTWKVSGSFTVDFEVTVTAFTEDEAWCKVEHIDADDILHTSYNLEDGIEIYDTTYGEVDWDDIEEY